ncbi:MAG: hypothetical protein RDV00_11320 [Clostridia bacterium]|nr:hypothetical protein [Clostridia bacterium]
MTEELNVLQDISQRLTLAGIPYMITGSMALSLYARPRMTRDIDIVILLSADDVDLLAATLDKVYYIDPDSVRRAMREPPHMFNVIHEQFIVKVDLILRPNTDYARTAFERRRSCDLFGQTVWVITPEDLILAKLNWARESHSELQLNDVRALLRSEELDMFYIQKWVYDLALQSIWKMVRS